jgi:hypothetical protein
VECESVSVDSYGSFMILPNFSNFSSGKVPSLSLMCHQTISSIRSNIRLVLHVLVRNCVADKAKSLPLTYLSVADENKQNRKTFSISMCFSHLSCRAHHITSKTPIRLCMSFFISSEKERQGHLQYFSCLTQAEWKLKRFAMNK